MSSHSNTSSTKSQLKLLPRGSEQQQICILCEIKSVFNEKFLKDSTSPVTLVHLWTDVSSPNTLAVVAQHHDQRLQLRPHWQRLAGDKWTFWDWSSPEATFSVSHQKFAHLHSVHTCTFSNHSPRGGAKETCTHPFTFSHICTYSDLVSLKLGWDFMNISSIYTF